MTETGEGHELMVGFVACGPQMFDLFGNELAGEFELFRGGRALVSDKPGVGDLLRKRRAQRSVKVGGSVPRVQRVSGRVGQLQLDIPVE